jgi:hypothetical protein
MLPRQRILRTDRKENTTFAQQQVMYDNLYREKDVPAATDPQNGPKGKQHLCLATHIPTYTRIYTFDFIYIFFFFLGATAQGGFWPPFVLESFVTMIVIQGGEVNPTPNPQRSWRINFFCRGCLP